MNIQPLVGCVIAIDGPAASGKGTLARRLAAALGLEYLDTGKLYRVVALMMLRNFAFPRSAEAALHASEMARNIDFSLLEDSDLATEATGEIASFVSAIPEVRAELFSVQRRFAQQPKGAVLDGRDIGTVICPDATIKLFITARLEARAERRYKELQHKGFDVIYPAVLEDLKARDYRDQQRDIAPLLPASDALVIDTSDMDADDVFSKVLAIVKQLEICCID
jgi:cytidylate kinase